MEVLRDGTFAFRVRTEDLSRGLRPSKRNPRNARFLVECIGAVGIDNVLSVIDDLENDRIDTDAIGASFPYPQIFVFINIILVCTATNIYSWDGSSLTLEHGPVTTGQLWSALDFYDFIYMTNNEVAVKRDPKSGNWSTSSSYPEGSALCNYNGQVLVGFEK